MKDMTVNPDKSPAMIKKLRYDLNTNNSIIISSVDSVTLLGIEIANELNYY